jgi:hypothetical protein
VVLVTAPLEMMFSFTRSFVLLVRAVTQSSLLKSHTPTSLSVRVFLAMLAPPV